MSEHICGNCSKHDHGYPGQFPYGGHKSQDIMHRDEKAQPLHPATLHPNGRCRGLMPGVTTGWFGGETCPQWEQRTAEQEQAAA